ncbi:MAG: PEGA domain-containing protein [Polyangiales bacterium]
MRLSGQYPTMRALVTAGLALILRLSTTSVAMAGEPTTEEIKASADAAFDGRSYATALKLYQQVLAQGGDGRMHYNIAQTLTALERYPEALLAYQAFLADAPAGTLNAAQQERFFALLDELKAKIARLEVHCEVPGARVLVRDRALGLTPLAGAVSVNAGPAKVEVIADGFKPFMTEIDLAGGATQTLEVKLERIDFTGSLAVRSTVADTHVFVDDIDKGTTPLTLRVERGKRSVRAKHDGYFDENTTVSIEVGGRREVSFSPALLPDYTLAYVGFGVGGVGVAAGTVTGIFAFTKFGSAKPQCDTVTAQCGPAGQADLQTSKTYGVLSTVAFGVGAVGIGFGVYEWLTARKSPAPGTRVEVVLLPGGLGMQGVF